MPSKHTPRSALGLHILFTQAYHRGKITLKQLSGMYKLQRYRDDEGSIWCLGIGTGRWYHWSDEGWVSGYPKSDLIPLTLKELRESLK